MASGGNGHGTATEAAGMLREAVPISRYVFVVTKTDVTFRGALVGNTYDTPAVELRGVQVAEFADGIAEPRWRTLDGPVIIYRDNVDYIVERP